MDVCDWLTGCSSDWSSRILPVICRNLPCNLRKAGGWFFSGTRGSCIEGAGSGFWSVGSDHTTPARMKNADKESNMAQRRLCAADGNVSSAKSVL
jgi:hypothetical protein